MSPEFEILLQACAWSFRPRRGEGSPEPAREFDVEAAASLSRRHRVQPLLVRYMDANGIHCPPALRADCDRQLATNLLAAAQADALLKAFGARSIPLLFLKGLPLSAIAYGDAFVKVSLDIDILVPEQAISEAAQVLAACGFVLHAPAGIADAAALVDWHRAHKESVWRHAASGLLLDLHGRLSDHPCLIPGIGVDAPGQCVDIGNGIKLPTLADEPLFAYLCVHGASSAWFRLKWVADLAGFLDGRTPEDIEQLYAMSQQLGAARAAAQGLLLADHLFGTLKGTQLREGLKKDGSNRRLLAIALKDLLAAAEPTDRRLGTMNIHISQLMLVPGLKAKAAELARQLRKRRLEGR